LQCGEDLLLARVVELEELLGLATDLGDAEEQVLGRGVLVAEPRASSWRSMTRFARGSRVASRPDPGATQRIAASSREAGRSTPSHERLRGTPSSTDERFEQCSASSSGLFAQRSCAATMASAAFSVND
jgi:hypothetical protein